MSAVRMLPHKYPRIMHITLNILRLELRLRIDLLNRHVRRIISEELFHFSILLFDPQLHIYGFDRNIRIYFLFITASV